MEKELFRILLWSMDDNAIITEEYISAYSKERAREIFISKYLLQKYCATGITSIEYTMADMNAFFSQLDSGNLVLSVNYEVLLPELPKRCYDSYYEDDEVCDSSCKKCHKDKVTSTDPGYV